MRCFVCGNDPCICKGLHVDKYKPIDIPNADDTPQTTTPTVRSPKVSNLRYVRTGKTSFLKLNAEDYKAWKAAGNTEYQAVDAPAEDAPADEPDAKADEQPAETKQQDAPAENKARKAPAAKKSEG